MAAAEVAAAEVVDSLRAVAVAGQAAAAAAAVPRADSGVGAAGLAGALDRRVDADKVYKWVCTTGKGFFAAHLSGGAAGIDSRHASIGRNAGFGIAFRRVRIDI